VREALLGAAAIGVACTVGALLSRSVRELRRLEEEDVVPPAVGRDLESAPAPALPVT